MYFKNRSEAGVKLAEYLKNIVNDDTLIFALPRGGVVVGYEIAQAFRKPLYPFIAKKIPAPGNREFGIGAVSEGDVLILNIELLEEHNIDRKDVDLAASEVIDDVGRKIALYRNGESLPGINNRSVVLIDDGLATGVTAHAALTAIHNMNPSKLYFASPVCSFYSVQVLNDLVDDMICVLKPFDLLAIGAYYQNFEQVSDETVIELLSKANLGYI